MASFPENGLALYKTLDYWTCKELLDIASSGKINPEDKYQSSINKQFNSFLQNTNRKFEWQYVDRKLNIYEVYKKTLEDSDK